MIIRKDKNLLGMFFSPFYSEITGKVWTSILIIKKE